MANTNRRKGHEAERKYAKEFRELGYERCATSRQESRSLDDAKVDLANIPFNIQVKTGYKKGINYAALLQEIDTNIKERFLEREDFPTLIIHQKPPGRGKKFTKYNELVIMTFEDFKKLIKKK